jgi:hypothetical protein
MPSEKSSGPQEDGHSHGITITKVLDYILLLFKPEQIRCIGRGDYARSGTKCHCGLVVQLDGKKVLYCALLFHVIDTYFDSQISLI